MYKYNGNDNCYDCIYFIVNHNNKTYYCGKAKNLENRLINHHHMKNKKDIVYILEKNVDINDLEYVWLWWFKNNTYKNYECLNKDFNTGYRFKFCNKSRKISVKYIKDSNYYKYCLLGHIQDCSGIL